VTKTRSGEKYSTATLLIPLVFALNKVHIKCKFSKEIQDIVESLKKSIGEQFGNLVEQRAF
jgi:hypothetical protein